MRNMIKILSVFILWNSSLIGQTTLCKIDKNNISQILDFGSNNKDYSKRPFELNCKSFVDTLTFYFYNNNGDIGEEEIFNLANNRIAQYKRTQYDNSRLILWQPEPEDNFYRINFIRYCGGEEVKGYLKVYCDNTKFELKGTSFSRSVE